MRECVGPRIGWGPVNQGRSVGEGVRESQSAERRKGDAEMIREKLKQVQVFLAPSRCWKQDCLLGHPSLAPPSTLPHLLPYQF